MKSAPLVSAIISVYNGERYIYECLKSAVGQSYSPLEVVVCDDGSTDHTAEITKGFGPSVKYIYQENLGQGVGRNRAAKESTGEYLAFLDADDIWKTDKIQKQMSVFDHASELVGVYSDMEVIDAEGKFVRYFARNKMKRGIIFDDLIGGSYVCGLSSLIVRREAFLAAGGFSTHRYCQDFVLLLHLAHQWTFDYCEESLVLYREHEGNMTSKLDISYPELLGIYGDLPKMFPLTLHQRQIAKNQMKRLYHSYAYLHFLRGKAEKTRTILLDASSSGLLYWKSRLLGILAKSGPDKFLSKLLHNMK